MFLEETAIATCCFSFTILKLLLILKFPDFSLTSKFPDLEFFTFSPDFSMTVGTLSDFLVSPPQHFVENYMSKMSPCPDPYPNPSGWWFKMWTYRSSQNFAVSILEVTTFLTEHIFDKMSCITLSRPQPHQRFFWSHVTSKGLRQQ